MATAVPSTSTYDDFGGGFGIARPFAFNVFDYIPVLLILRLFRKEIAIRINTWAQKFTLEGHARRKKNLAKSHAAQVKFEASRKIGEAEAAHVIENQHKVGTIVELWHTAVKNYADVVEAHGPFSGELLRAMLEIPEEGGRRGGGARPNRRMAAAVPDGSDEDTEKTTPDSENKEYTTKQEAGVGMARQDIALSRFKRSSSFESIDHLALPEESETVMLFDSAWRKMPPLLTEWESVIIAVDAGRYSMKYFNAEDNEFLGRVNLDDVSKVTLSTLVIAGGDKRKMSYLESAKKNLGFAGEGPTSPASTSALSPRASRGRNSAVDKMALEVMLLLNDGQILHVMFSGSEEMDLDKTTSTIHSTFSKSRSREFANLICKVTGLELNDEEEMKLAGHNKHRRRISVKW